MDLHPVSQQWFDGFPRSHWLFSVVTSLTGEQGEEGREGRGEERRGFDSLNINNNTRPRRGVRQQIQDTPVYTITARTVGELCLFAAHKDAINNRLITTEYDEHRKQMKNPSNRLQTLELALELKENSPETEINGIQERNRGVIDEAF